MGKHNNVNFLQLNREIFNGKHKSLKWGAKYLYAALSELEHKFTGTKEDFFFRATKDLEGDTGMSAKTIRKYRNQLVDAGLIQTWRMHWVDQDTQKQSEKSVMAFRILR